MAWNETTHEKNKRITVRHGSDLTDREWAVIEGLFPPPSKQRRRRKTDPRSVVDAMMHYGVNVSVRSARGRRGIFHSIPA